MKLYLASGSPRRRELLERCGLDFEVLKMDVEEDYTPDKPYHIVELLSKRKAEAAEKMMRGKKEAAECVILCADTMVAVGDEILGKPTDREDAARMIRLIQGSTHQVYTGVTIVRMSERASEFQTFYEQTDVSVRPMTEEDITAYVKSGECDDKAGAYAIQGIVAKYIDHCSGVYDNVVGLRV